MKLVLIFSLCLVGNGAGDWEKNSNVIMKSNAIGRWRRPVQSYFRTDKDIQHYLKAMGVDMMVWRCLNAIQPHYEFKPITAVDDKYQHVVNPHIHYGKAFSRWIDYQLIIFNATHHDSGLYTFESKSVYGQSQQHYIYLDISENK